MHGGVPRAASRGVDNYHVSHDPGGPASLSATVVHALADVMNADVTETERALYEAMDPAALDRLFVGRSTVHPPSHVAFETRGYRVTVYSDGQVVITPPRQA